MIVFAAITPHSPLLIPSIGKENFEVIKKTLAALQRLSDELYVSKPDAVVVMSFSPSQHNDAFSVNFSNKYKIGFKDFGDVSTKAVFEADTDLVAQIQKHAKTEKIPFTLDSHEFLDYGAGVPLYILAKNLNCKIVPLNFSGLDPREQYRFGVVLKEVFDSSNKRIAVIASGDMSHCLTTKSPLGLKTEGKQYDEAVQDAIKNFSLSTLLNMDQNLIRNSGQCMYEQILMLFGILEKKNVRPEILSYEFPFGVGYLVAQFHFL
jgi:AmmeMemoRadiSam system protein B